MDHQWNWQNDSRLERESQAEEYEAFLTKIVGNKNVVKEYYDHDTTNHNPEIKFGFM